jgi:hypothetical protein
MDPLTRAVQHWLLKRAKIEAITMQWWVARRRNRFVRADADMCEAVDDSKAPRLVDQARRFYAEHRAEVVERMRHPSTPAYNPAATVVLICETDLDLRREAHTAQQAARGAHRRSASVIDTLHHYLPNAERLPTATLSEGSS